jgi:hypothetical protein
MDEPSGRVRFDTEDGRAIEAVGCGEQADTCDYPARLFRNAPSIGLISLSNSTPGGWSKVRGERMTRMEKSARHAHETHDTRRARLRRG